MEPSAHLCGCTRSEHGSVDFAIYVDGAEFIDDIE
jgi:hypothetical protein